MIVQEVELTKEQIAKLETISVYRGTTVSKLIQQSVEEFIRSEDIVVTRKKNITKAPWGRATAVIGKFHAKETDLAENHDKYLAEIYAQVSE